MRFGSRGPREFLMHVTENSLTEKAWEDAVQGPGNIYSRRAPLRIRAKSEACALGKMALVLGRE